MTVFKYALKRLLRNKFNLFTIFLLTPLFIGFTFGLGSFDRKGIINVGLVDLDFTPFTEKLAREIAASAQVWELAEGDIRSALAQDRVDFVLVIDKDFTQETIGGNAPNLRSFSIKETDIASRIILKIEGFLGAARSIAATAAGDQALFYQGLDAYLEGSFRIKTQAFSRTDKSVENTLNSLGLLAFSMMMLSTFSANNLIREREDRTFYRVMSSPCSLKGYMLQNILGYLLILLWQVLAMLVAVKWIFGFNLGPSLFNLFLVMAVFAAFCVSLGIALAAIARTARQAGTIASLTITPVAMLSGLYWPRSLMPRFLQLIGRYLPPAWLIEAAGKVLQGKPLSGAGLELTILLGYTLVFFLLGTWRRGDVAN